MTREVLALMMLRWYHSQSDMDEVEYERVLQLCLPSFTMKQSSGFRDEADQFLANPQALAKLLLLIG